MARRVVQFSCGSASAVAAKLTVTNHTDVAIINAFIKEEHPDNRRFLADCEKWIGREITVLRDERFGASVHEVWRREKFMVSAHGAPCSRALKQRVMDAWKRPDDIMVLGFTAEEEDRYDDLCERLQGRKIEAPLIAAGLTKADCHGLLTRAGIMLPQGYRDGFLNANCRGCPKGGMGYWNKVRVVYPEFFAEAMAIQESIGPGAYFFVNRTTGERFGLKDLRPDQGRIEDEPEIECSFFCALADQEFRRAALRAAS